ncbi:Methyl-accepting chemotaxis protein [Erwinia rhapontici]|uniref:hypothetical protein n=1 Tax=Erwinia rhapontici TaxID=55212 RepID=UPI003D35E805
MTTKKFYQLVDIPDVRFTRGKSIDFGSIATDCETKTTSILEAINFISLQLSSIHEEGSTTSEVSNLSCIIADLADLGIATNKIASSANYSAGYLDGKNDN